MVFQNFESGIQVERDRRKISQFSEIQTRKGTLCGVQEIGDSIYKREHFVLFRTNNGKTCHIQIGALKNCDSILIFLNVLLRENLEKPRDVDNSRTTRVPIPEVDVLAEAAKLKPRPARRYSKPEQERIALIRRSAERIFHD